nr:hypothetical protein [Tanacetum cinerariifolium]
MELHMINRKHGRMILEFVENGPLIWPLIKENGVTRPKKYSELSATEAFQADCDVKATNIILQGLPPEENGVTRPKKYSELSATEAIQAYFDVKATNIIIQGLPPEVYALVSNHKVTKELWKRIQLLMQGTSLTKQEREYPGITEGQAIQTVITHNDAYQDNDLDAYDFDCDELNTAKVAQMENLSRYGLDGLAEVHNHNNVNNNMINQAIHEMPSSKQSNIMNHSETKITNDSNILPYSQPIMVEVLKELPKVSMVNTSLKKLKHYLAGFDVVVKERTMTTSITESVEMFDLNASLQEKVLVITALKNALRKLKGKALADDVVTSHSIDLEMLNLDMEPLNPRLLNNRSTHSDYLKRTQEEAAILQDLGVKITTTTDVPSRKSIAIDTDTPKPVVTLVYSRKPRISKSTDPVSKSKVVQIVLWYLNSGCSKHMTGDRS